LSFPWHRRRRRLHAPAPQHVGARVLVPRVGLDLVALVDEFDEVRRQLLQREAVPRQRPQRHVMSALTFVTSARTRSARSSSRAATGCSPKR
jgi:hypothetical protein